MKKPRISVIIPTINEEKYIGNNLISLKNQPYKRFEIIVVDGGSDDNTQKIASKYAEVIVDRRKGVSVARNSGAKIAKGEVLLFLDADTKPSKNLLKIYAEIFEDKGIVAATGPILPLEKVRRRIVWGYKFVSILLVKASIKIGRPSIVGSNFAVRKSSFNQVKGFDERLMTYEDWDLSNKLKKLGRIVFSRDAVVYTSVRRIKAWGMWGYFLYHSLNVFRYHLFRRPQTVYRQIR